MRTSSPANLLLHVGVLAVVWSVHTEAPACGADVRVDYTTQIKPLLHERCYACHGALKQNSNLRLDTVASIRRGGDSGPAVVPGRSATSLLIEAVTGDPAVWRMPPEGEPLTADQIAVLRRWIDQGAPIPDHDEPEPDPREHWAFQTPSRPAVPQVNNAAWVQNPIDAFLAAEHERLQLQPAPPAARHTLLRRVFLDLIGLPPTREQAQAFFAHPSETAYRDLVTQLLEAPEHGQRWARHWMDVWRYSDWSGENKNLVRGSPKHIWRWRDWVIESVNSDKPYDRMIVEMLAGDEIDPANPDVLRATGFLARNWYEFNRNVWLDDTVEHTAKAFLGLSLSCARCHDHKFDPFDQQEYYAWRAIFEPHDLRIDPVGGEIDLEKDGIPRVYDARLDTPTYLLIRGEESRPDKDHPLAPTVPLALGGQFAVQPIALSLDVYYPAMSQVAIAAMIRQAEAECAASESAFAEQSRLKADDRTSDAVRADRDVALKIAQQRVAAAHAELASLRARIAAERARLGISASESANEAAAPTDGLAIAAAAAERLAVLRRAELAVSRNEQKLAAARDLAAKSQGGKKAEANVTAADKEFQAARKALSAAQSGMNETDSRYRPLGPVYPNVSTGRRLALARWMTDPRNPLTARVAVNHVWLRHFGEPLVATVDDFGRRSPRPRHAALLDWLAVEFMESGWSLKKLHYLIVTSSAYRMSSSTRDTPHRNLEIDGENRFLWRMNSRRAEGEVIRDSILHVAGNLDRSHGGPEIPLDQAETSRRRSLYFRHAFERQVPFLEIFDGADAMECYRRAVTVMPQQALALANSALPYEQAHQLAEKLTSDQHASGNVGFVNLAFEHLLTRPPTPAEMERCRRFLEDGSSDDSDSSRLRASLIHALMNHNDFITLR